MSDERHHQEFLHPDPLELEGPKEEWEKVLYKEGLGSKYLNTQLLLDHALDLQESKGLDKYLEEELKTLIDERRVEIQQDIQSRYQRGEEDVLNTDIEAELTAVSNDLTKKLDLHELKARIDSILQAIDADKRIKRQDIKANLRKEYIKFFHASEKLEALKVRRGAKSIEFQNPYDPQTEEDAPETNKESEQYKFKRDESLYVYYAPGFLNNENNIQDRFANYSLDEYLAWCYHNIGTEGVPFPHGCETQEDLLKPFWQTDYVEITVKGEPRRVYLGSELALEHGESFFGKAGSKLLSHINENVKQGKRLSETAIQEVNIRQIYKSFREFLQDVAERTASGELHLPEDAEDLEDAFRSQTENEVASWFDQNPNDIELKKFLYQESGGFGAGNMSGQEDIKPEIGDIDASDYWKKRWKEEKEGKKVEYNPPIDSSSRTVEVPAGFASAFYARGDGIDSTFEVSGEASARVGNLEVDFSELNSGNDFVHVSYVAKIENRETGRLQDKKVDLVFNLPVEAVVAAKNGGEAEIKAAIAACIVKNQGYPYAQSAYVSNNVMFGLGEKNRPTLGVTLSPDSLRKIAGDKADDVVTFLDRKARPFKDLDWDTEVEPMWQFERFLLDQYVPGQNKKLKQLVWDEAFRQVWEGKIGAEKLAQLKEAAAQMPTESPNAGTRRRGSNYVRPAVAGPEARHPDKNRWQIEPMTELNQDQQRLRDLIVAKFGGDYLAAFNAKAVFTLCNEAKPKIKFSEAITLFANKLLLEQGRQAEFEEMQRFADLSSDKQQAELHSMGADLKQWTTGAMLVFRLGQLLEGSAAGQATGGAITAGRKQALPEDYVPGLAQSANKKQALTADYMRPAATPTKRKQALPTDYRPPAQETLPVRNSKAFQRALKIGKRLSDEDSAQPDLEDEIGIIR